MATWGEILAQINQEISKGHHDALDRVRRDYLSKLAQHTGRHTILYATKWTAPGDTPAELLSITEEDLQGFMEVVHGCKTDKLDIILHTPGGSPTATEAIVTYLRAKFNNIRVIVPQAAMSAGTMLCCASDSIVLAKHSSLGPVDPQMILNTSLGFRAVPAQAILDQFDFAMEQCKDANKLGAWLPILNQYGPGLLVECKNALKLSVILTRDWLEKYMFVGLPRKEAKKRANKIASVLSDHSRFKSHGRHINRASAQDLNFNVEELEGDQTLQDLVLSVFHSANHTFGLTMSAKIIENHMSRAFIKISQTQQVRMMPMMPAPAPAPSQPPQSAPNNVT